MPFLGFLIFIGLLCWMFLGKSKSEQSPLQTFRSSEISNLDYHTRFKKLLGSGKDAISRQVAREKWPYFGAALFVRIREEHYPLRYQLNLSELAKFTKSDFEEKDLSGLAKLAASHGLLRFTGSSVDLEYTPSFDELLQELFL